MAASLLSFFAPSRWLSLTTCPLMGQEVLVVSPSACSSEPPMRQLGRAKDRAQMVLSNVEAALLFPAPTAHYQLPPFSNF